MSKYLVSNVVDRKHSRIFRDLGPGAFFDMSPAQTGWDEFSEIAVGDTVYVINKNRNVTSAYRVARVLTGILLADDPEWGSRIESDAGGTTKVLFGKVFERVDEEYSRFVRNRDIRSTKLDPETGQMYQGFNCAKF